MTTFDTGSKTGCSVHGSFDICGHDDSTCPNRKESSEIKKGRDFREINTQEGLIEYKVLGDIAFGDKTISEDGFAERQAAYEKRLRDEPNSTYAQRTRDILNSIDEGNLKILGVYGTQDQKDVLLAAGSIEIKDEGGGKRGFIYSDATRPSARGRGLMEKLTDQRIAWAKEQPGCTGVDATVLLDNPIGLATKLKSGFRIVKIGKREDGKSNCFISYDFADNNRGYERPRHSAEDLVPESTQEAEMMEVGMDEVDTIGGLLENSWEGIDIKNIGSATDNTPDNWVLILQKIS